MDKILEKLAGVLTAEDLQEIKESFESAVEERLKVKLEEEKTKVQDENSENYGKEVFRELGYYVSIESCLKGYLTAVTREFISGKEENDLKELMTQVQLQNEFIESLKLNI